MQKAAEQFADHFKNWDIHLPEDAVQAHERGKINKAGWSIWYLFGSDEQGEYLDYYASHRMTIDSHVRIRADGAVEHLPALEEMFVGSDDPAEHARLKAEFLRGNREIGQLLDAKGFGLSGDEPLSNQVRRVQMTGDVESVDSRSDSE